jgi:hypothetical protein
MRNETQGPIDHLIESVRVLPRVPPFGEGYASYDGSLADHWYLARYTEEQAFTETRKCDS